MCLSYIDTKILSVKKMVEINQDEIQKLFSLLVKYQRELGVDPALFLRVEHLLGMDAEESEDDE